MKWFKFLFLAGALTLAGWWLWQRYFVSDTTRIQRALDSAARAVEQNRLIKLESFITQDYSDSYGLDKTTLLGTIRQFRSQYGKVVIQLSEVKITIEPGGQKAEAVLTAKARAAPVESGAQTEVRSEQLRLLLRKTDQSWRMYRAESLAVKPD